MAGELKPLITRRRQLKSQLTRFAKFMQEIKDNENVNQVKIRKSKIDEVWREFEHVQSEIEENDSESEQEAHRIEFEETYFKATAEAESFIEKKSNEEARGTRSESIGSNTPQDREQMNSFSKNDAPVKLAALNVPMFSGNYQKWSGLLHFLFAY